MQHRAIAPGARVGVVAVMGLALVASASAPKPHAFVKTMDLAASYDAMWSAVIEVFADRNWAISNMEKDSGLITTDWMRLGPDEKFADCGGSGLSSVQGREIRFNVFVREQPTGVSATVNASFRESRAWDGRQWYVDCASTGGVERLVHQLVTERIASRPTRPLERTVPVDPVSSIQDAAPVPDTSNDGTLGGRCYGNHTCNDGLRCDDILGQCVGTP